MLLYFYVFANYLCSVDTSMFFSLILNLLSSECILIFGFYFNINHDWHFFFVVCSSRTKETQMIRFHLLCVKLFFSLSFSLSIAGPLIDFSSFCIVLVMQIFRN